MNYWQRHRSHGSVCPSELARLPVIQNRALSRRARFIVRLTPRVSVSGVAQLDCVWNRHDPMALLLVVLFQQSHAMGQATISASRTQFWPDSVWGHLDQHLYIMRRNPRWLSWLSLRCLEVATRGQDLSGLKSRSAKGQRYQDGREPSGTPLSLRYLAP
jgi:hypothetical protein